MLSPSISKHLIFILKVPNNIVYDEKDYSIQTMI